MVCCLIPKNFSREVPAGVNADALANGTFYALELFLLLCRVGVSNKVEGRDCGRVAVTSMNVINGGCCQSIGESLIPDADVPANAQGLEHYGSEV